MITSRVVAVLALTTVFGTAASAADKNEDKARDVATAFAKAVKMKDADAAAKLAAAPFLVDRGNDADLYEKVADVKAELKKVFDRVEPGRVPTEVKTVFPAERVGAEFKDKNRRERIEAAIGKDGYAVLLVLEQGKGQIGFVVLVAPRGGEMKVVGMVD